MKQITLRITEEQDTKLKEAAYQQRTSVNGLMQYLINNMPSDGIIRPPATKSAAEKIQVKEKPQNIKKLPQVQAAPVDEDDLDFGFREPKKRLTGVSVYGKTYTLDQIANEARADIDDIKAAWKEGRTPYSILGGKTLQASWITELDTGLDDPTV